MAPPNKRRRLLSSKAGSSPSHSEFLPEEPTPTLLHSVEQLEHRPSTPVAHTVPKRIEEIHLQIQKRAVNHKKAYWPLYPRQGATAITTLVTSIDDLGQTIVTEITIGATTTTPTPSDTPDSSASSTTSDSTSSPSLSSTIGNSRKCISCSIHDLMLTVMQRIARGPQHLRIRLKITRRHPYRVYTLQPCRITTS